MMKRLSGTFRRRSDTLRPPSSALGSLTPRTQEPTPPAEPSAPAATTTRTTTATTTTLDAVAQKPSKLPQPASSRARGRAAGLPAKHRRQQHKHVVQPANKREKGASSPPAPPQATRTDRAKSMGHTAAHVIVRGTATFRANSMVEPSPEPDRRNRRLGDAAITVERQTMKTDIPFFSDAAVHATTPAAEPIDSENHPTSDPDISVFRPPKNPSVLVRRVSGSIKTGLRVADPNTPDAAVLAHRTVTAPDMLSTAKPAKYPRQQTFAPSLPLPSTSSSDGIPREWHMHSPRTASPVQRSISPLSHSLLESRPAVERRRPARWSPDGALPASFGAISQRRDKAEARSLAAACGSLEKEIAAIELQARDSASDTDIAAFLESRAAALRQVLANLEDRYDSIETYYVKGREYAQAMGRFYQVSSEEYERWSRASHSSSLSSSRRPSSKSNGRQKSSLPSNIESSLLADNSSVRMYMR